MSLIQRNISGRNIYNQADKRETLYCYQKILFINKSVTMLDCLVLFADFMRLSVRLKLAIDTDHNQIIYCISADLIQIAKERYGSEPKMGYFKKKMETQFKDLEKFDVAISFCALHWVNDIKTTNESSPDSINQKVSKGILIDLVRIDTRR